ncbi:MAG: hypothetical protein ACRC10_12325 [Thermoguttaceae bacterium]
MMFPNQKKSFPTVLFLLSFLLTFSLSSSVFAQLYPGWRMRDGAEKEAESSKEISAALQNGNLDKPKFDSYFNNYYFHRWTWPKQFDNLNTFVRRDLLDTDLAKATGPARTYLLERTLAALGKMKGDPLVHPAARFNAVLVLGLLYEDVGKTKLYSKALPLLIEEYQNPNAPDPNRLGAIIGISRFAQLGIEDPKLRDEDVPQLLIQLVQQKNAPTGRNPDQHDYFFRVRAIEGLGGLIRSVGPKPEFVETLLERIQDNKELDQIRYLSAKALAEINYSKAASDGLNLDINRIAVVLRNLARYACDEEKRYIERLETGGGRGPTSSSTPSASSGPPGRSGSGSTSSGSSGGTGSSGPAPAVSSSSSSSNSKEVTDKKIEHCITRSKFALGSFQEAIKGYAGPDAGLMNALKTAGTPESLGNQKVLGQIDKLIKEEYFKFLNTGPEQSKTPRPTTPPPSSGSSSMSSSSSSSPPPPPSSPKASGKGPKVTFKDMKEELGKLGEKMDEVVEQGPANLPTPTETDNEEGADYSVEGADVDF